MDIMVFIDAHSSEIAQGIVSIAMTFAITELIKPWLVLALSRFESGKILEHSALRTMSFLATLVPVIALDFRDSWEVMTGRELDVTSSVLVGCTITWTATQVAWVIGGKLEPVRALRAYFYRKLGVEDLLDDRANPR